MAKKKAKEKTKREMESLIEQEVNTAFVEDEDDDDDSIMSLEVPKKGFDFKDIESQIIDVDDIPLYLSIVGYGKNGTGKTRFLGTCPQPLVFDFREKGTITIKGKGAKMVKIRTIDQIEGFFWYLATQKHPFKTIGFDTVTQMNDISLKSVMGIDQWEVGEAVQMAHKRHYGENTQLMKFWIMNFRDIENMHKVFLCQQKTTNDEDLDDEAWEVTPHLSDAVLKCLAGAVDIIAQFHIKEVPVKGSTKTKPQFRVRVGPSERYLTKFRIPDEAINMGYKPPSLIKDPSFDKIMDIYNEVDTILKSKGGKK